VLKVLIADDHAIVRHGVHELLVDEFKDVECGEAANAAQVLTRVREQAWDLVILDIHMPGRGGLEVLQDLTREYPKLPVLVLSMSPEKQFAVRAFKAGAAGYLTKESALQELVTAVRTILDHRKYVSATLAEALAASLTTQSERLPDESLSDREYLVLRRLAAGKTVSEIAKELALSVKTISTYRTRMLAKLDLRNNAELTAYAIRRGLVD
jgi:DNA-binding NarL/FixJ family response regulator